MAQRTDELSGKDDVRPIPDPTRLTTEQLAVAIINMKELFAAQLESFTTRLQAMDKAIILLQDQANRSPSISEVYLQHEERFKSGQSQLEAVKELLLSEITERFNKVSQQFDLIERQRVEQKKDTKDAVDAALTAQKEAVKEQTTASERAIAKSEAFTTKQIDAIGAIMQNEAKGVNDKFDDLKTRLTTVEGRASVADPAMSQAVNELTRTVDILKSSDNRGQGTAQGASAVWGIVVGGIGLLVAIVVAVAAVAVLFKPH